LLRDIFPNVRITEFEYEELRKALTQAFEKHKLICNNKQLKKALEVSNKTLQNLTIYNYLYNYFKFFQLGIFARKFFLPYL
jgi:hypothetical protein